MDYELINKAVKIIKERVLTPVIYMSEHDDWAEFICFCDGKITVLDLYETEQEVKAAVSMDIEIIDIREFSEAERLEIIDQCTLVHSENPIIEKIFAGSMLTDYQNLMNEKRDMLTRQKESGTCYVQ